MTHFRACSGHPLGFGSLTSAAATLALFLPALGYGQSLTVAEPLDGSSVADRSVVVRGSTDVGANVAINGVPVAVFDSGTTRGFSVLTKLTPGLNSIQVSAALPGAAPVITNIAVTSTDVTPFSVQAAPAEGVAALQVQFHVTRYQSQDIARVEIDFESDGQTDLSRDGNFEGTSRIYETPGIHTATFRIIGGSGAMYSYPVPVTVASSAVAATAIAATWSSFRAALLADDYDAAVSLLSERAAEQYGPALQYLDGQLAAFANSLSAPEFIAQQGREYEYFVVRTIGGTQRAFFVYFADVKGEGWRITGF